MSELDADIYGDLYQTAEVPEEEQDEVLPAVGDGETEQPTKTTLTNSSKSSTTEASKPVISMPAASTTQQIPTYEEEPSDYRQQKAPVAFQSNNIHSFEPTEDGKMFIGGLHWDTTDDGLREYFSQFGPVDACNIMRDPAGRSRCFAFLTFRDAESVNKVVTTREHLLDGKIIDPKRAIPRQEHQRATKLFIGGLPGTVTSESMREFFSQFGRVVESTVMLDQNTGRSKGFGFISFEDTDVTPFLGFGNLEIDGKLIDVKLAQPRYQREANEQGAGGAGASNFNNAPNRVGSAGGFNAAAGGGTGNFGGAGGQGNTPFDPQALANLYTRMFQMASGQSMGMMGNMGNMGMMGGGMRGGGMMGGMGMNGGNPMSGMSNMGNMGRGGMLGQNNSHIPKGPRGGAPSGGGPQRPGRGQHGYHPYSR